MDDELTRTPQWEVLFLLLPDSLLLDWAGPAEALRMANKACMARGSTAPFRLRFISPNASTCSSVGVVVSGLEALPQSFTVPSWVVVVGQPGALVSVGGEPMRAALHWLRGLRLLTGQLELITVCAGAVIAAHAGLLAHRQVTTHHHHLEELQAIEPACRVLANRVLVQDGPVSSSAGITTGVDLFLHRIAQVCGAAIAAQVAQTMVVAMRRGPQDPALSPFLAHRNHLHAAVHRIQDALSHAPAQPWTVPAMADVGHTSARHLARLFVEHAGITPLEYLRKIRLASAQAALQSGRNVTQAAELAGFSSDTQLRRAWRHFGLGGTPSQAASDGG
jgi:transcriptional regulator GlxA family with amidase domain